MRIPRDIDGLRLAGALRVLGYERTRQEGSHIRLSTAMNGEHHVTIPAHRALKTGTFQGILKSIAAHHRLTVEELVSKLDL